MNTQTSYFNDYAFLHWLFILQRGWFFPIMLMIGHQTRKKNQFVYVGLPITCKTIYITYRDA